MKLLQIDACANSGSTGRIAEGIGQIVMANGWESYIAYGRRANKSESQLIRIGNKYDIYFHGLLTRVFDNHALGLSSKRATIKFIKEIERINPDIIHIHNSHGYYLNNEVLFKYLAQKNIPVVWTQHDCWAFTGHCAHFDFIGCDRWKTQCYSCPQKRSYPASYFIDNSKRNFLKKKKLYNSINNMTIVCVSYWLGDLVEESFLNKYQIKVIQNGIDINAFNIRDFEDVEIKYNLNDKFIILGVAGVWTDSKGFKDFIELSKLIKEDERIVLVGLTKDQIKSLPNNIYGIERTESVEELAQLYSIADVYFNASVEETFGLTTVEAFACGTPAIVYNKTAIPEVIDEKVGWIVEQGDIKSLYKIVVELKNEPELLRKVREKNCRFKAERLYNKDIKFKEYFELYKQLISENI